MIALPATYGETIRDILDREYRPYRNAAKRLAADAQTSCRTAEKWLAGESAPSGEGLVNLMARCEPLAASLTALAERRRADLHHRADAAVRAIKEGRHADRRQRASRGC